MQTLELDFLPLEAPKNQTPPTIRFTRFGHQIILNKSFLQKSGLDDSMGDRTIRLACDKKKPLDWYLVIDSGEGKPGVSSWDWNKAGDLVFKNTHWVKQFLQEFGEGKTAVQKLISTEPINLPDLSEAFAIITKS